MLCDLIRPDFLAERGKLNRVGRGLPLHDLAQGHRLAVPLAVRHVLHLHVVGRCAGSGDHFERCPFWLGARLGTSGGSAGYAPGFPDLDRPLVGQRAL